MFEEIIITWGLNSHGVQMTMQLAEYKLLSMQRS